MEKTITEALNVLPRLSYRWLGLNTFDFQEDIKVAIKPYSQAYLPTEIDSSLVLQAMPGLPRRSLGTENHGVSRELVELTTENPNGGFYLEIPRGKHILEPLYVQYHFSDENDTLLDHNVIMAQENSEITVLIEYLAGSKNPAFHNGFTRIIAAKGAKVNLIKVQRLNDKSVHLDSHHVDIGPYASVRYVQVELGSKYAITNYMGRIAENGVANVDSMYLGDAEQVLDLSYQMIHEGYKSESDILVRGALKDQARKVFRGTLDFRRGARLANGNEEENVLLLDSTVKSDAIPLLLSEEDDVQGGHAASAGKADPEQLFYLMSRGLSEEEATTEVVKASFQPVLDLLPAKQKETVERELGRKLVSSNA